jgi:hypothetical protein
MELTKHVTSDDSTDTLQELIYQYVSCEEKTLSRRRDIAWALYNSKNIRTLEEYDLFRETLKLEYQRQFARTKLFLEFHASDYCNSISYQYDIEYFEEGERLSRLKNRGMTLE